MAPKFSLARGYSERESNPSILVQDVGQDDHDLGDVWSERGPHARPHWRVSYPYKKARPTAWSSRITSLSSHLRGAGAALTTRAKQLHVPESTRWAVSRLRKPIAEPSSPQERSLPRAASMPVQHLSSESDADPFSDQPEAEEDDEDGLLEDNKPPRLHPSRSWTQGCT